MESFSVLSQKLFRKLLFYFISFLIQMLGFILISLFVFPEVSFPSDFLSRLLYSWYIVIFPPILYSLVFIIITKRTVLDYFSGFQFKLVKFLLLRQMVKSILLNLLIFGLIQSMFYFASLYVIAGISFLIYPLFLILDIAVLYTSTKFYSLLDLVLQLEKVRSNR
jgi:hypothetical protein